MFETTDITPPIKWAGGKHYLAAAIHELARQVKYTHRVITHAGGLQELWNWDYLGVSEVVNDINGWLTNLWDVLRDPGMYTEFRRKVDFTPFSEKLFQEALIAVDKPLEFFPKVDAAVYMFVAVRQSLAGRMESFAPLSRKRVRRGMNEQASAWITAISGMDRVHRRLMRVVVLNKDAISVIRKEDGPETLFYCDPPYVPETRTSPVVYKYEMTLGHHEDLLRALGKIEGKFILSGYRHPLYDYFAKENKWGRKDIEVPNNASGEDEKRTMVECLWYNYDFG